MRLAGGDGQKMKITPASNVTRGMIATGITLPLLIMALEPWTRLQLSALCSPAAYLSAGFIGAKALPTGDGYIIPAALPIEVTLACSGLHFFCLCLAVLFGLAIERRWPWRRWLLLIPTAYAGTVLANTSRILSTWYVDAWVAPHLPTSFQAGLHGLTGALVFTTTLAALYLITWRTCHEHRTKTPAA